MTKVMCRKCLLADMDIDDMTQTILEYINNIPADRRTDEKTYRDRLEICRSCEHLMNGMCAKCGCFVELRAIKPHMYCASEEKKW